MSLSKEQLQELTDAIIERLTEFEIPSAMLPTRGVVRIAYEVIEAHISQQTYVARVKAAPNGGAREPLGRGAPPKERPVADRIAATLGPEHTVVTPLRPPNPDVARANIANMLANGSGGALTEAIARPRTLAEVDADSGTGLDRDKKADQLREIIHELQDMAIDEVMPTMTFWDNAKPPHLPKSQAIMKWHSLSWGELARYAHLEASARGPKAKAKVATRALADDADGEGEP